MRRIAAVSFFGLGMAIIACLQPVSACSITYPLDETGPSFRVQLHNPYHPAAGVEVRLSAYDELMQSMVEVRSVTNEKGVAHFRAVKLGRYFLGADHLNGVRRLPVPSLPKLRFPWSWCLDLSQHREEPKRIQAASSTSH